MSATAKALPEGAQALLTAANALFPERARYTLVWTGACWEAYDSRKSGEERWMFNYAEALQAARKLLTSARLSASNARARAALEGPR